MKNTETEVIDKLVEIAKLKKEVVQLILPEKTMQHLEVIGHELKAMLLESLCDDTSEQAQPASVKKVDIE
jgi:hypothetical protein